MADLAVYYQGGDEVGDEGFLLELAARGNPAWHRDAACKEAPAEVSWFPPRGADVRPAIRVCQTCLCQYECRAWSLGQDAGLRGIWGGWSENDRRKWRAERHAEAKEVEIRRQSPRPTPMRPGGWRKIKV